MFFVNLITSYHKLMDDFVKVDGEEEVFEEDDPDNDQ